MTEARITLNLKERGRIVGDREVVYWDYKIAESLALITAGNESNWIMTSQGIYFTPDYYIQLIELGLSYVKLYIRYGASITMKWKCSQQPSYICYQSIDADIGGFITKEECQATCKPPISCVINMNRPPSSIEIGQNITFSGSITCDGIGIGWQTIEIWDSLGIDEKIGSIKTASNGLFSISWTVKDINYYPNNKKIRVYAYAVEKNIKSSEFDISLTSIPPIDIRYSCYFGTCRETINGQYATLIECQNACKITVPSDKYVCVNGTCQKNNISGTMTLEQCQSTCRPIPPSPTTKYNCINNTCTSDANGVYSVEECQNICSPPSGCPAGYYKAADRKCKKYIKTPFGNMKEEDVLLLGIGTIGTIAGIILLEEVTK